MSGEVIDFARAKEERTPHMEGHALCLACRHRWVAVAPLGTVWLECPAPECRLLRGRFFVPMARGEDRWVCACGNDLFHHNSVRGLYCPHCGADQRGHDTP